MTRPRVLAVSALVAGALLLGYVVYTGMLRTPPTPSDAYRKTTLRVRESIIVEAEVPLTQAAKAQGLGQRDALADGQGMLFTFTEKDRHSFWMKDMRFNLDFLWITDNRITEITSNVPVPSSPTDLPVYRPREPVNAMLEVPAGYAERYGLRAGDSIDIPAGILLP